MRYNVTYTSKPGQVMSPRKTVTLNLRVDPAIRQAAKDAAAKEHRSVANLIEVLIRERCKELGISIPKQQGLFDDPDAGD